MCVNFSSELVSAQPLLYHTHVISPCFNGRRIKDPLKTRRSVGKEERGERHARESGTAVGAAHRAPARTTTGTAHRVDKHLGGEASASDLKHKGYPVLPPMAMMLKKKTPPA